MQTSDYLEQLQQDKQDLVDNLTTQGITGLTGDETFTELVPEVLNIETGGGGDVSEYFQSSGGVSSITTFSCGTWTKGIKKLPDTILSGVTLYYSSYFNQFKGEQVDLSLLDDKLILEAEYMFANCSNITNLNISKFILGDASILTRNKFQGMFLGCTNLVTLNMNTSLANIVASNAQRSLTDAFTNCSNLENLIFGYDYGKGFNSTTKMTYASLNFNNCSKLTYNSLMSIINGLYDITDKNYSTNPSVTLNATAYARLSANDISIATAKGWNVISA